MVKRVVGGVLMTGAALGGVLVVGIRRKYPPVLNAVRRVARDVGNPQVLKSAGAPGGPAAVIEHVGRVSGTPFRTPVTAVRTADGFVIGLPYGSNTDWLKNVLAAGSATIQHEGTGYPVDHPEVVPKDEVAYAFPAREQKMLGWFGVTEFLRLRSSDLEPADPEPAAPETAAPEAAEPDGDG